MELGPRTRPPHDQEIYSTPGSEFYGLPSSGGLDKNFEVVT